MTRLANNQVPIRFDVSMKLEVVSMLESKLTEMLCAIYRSYGEMHCKHRRSQGALGAHVPQGRGKFFLGQIYRGML